jgi:hypothetical protein
VPYENIKITKKLTFRSCKPGGEAIFEGWTNMKQKKVSEFATGN